MCFKAVSKVKGQPFYRVSMVVIVNIHQKVIVKVPIASAGKLQKRAKTQQ
jgi:hypothetical protein